MSDVVIELGDADSPLVRKLMKKASRPGGCPLAAAKRNWFRHPEDHGTGRSGARHLVMPPSLRRWSMAKRRMHGTGGIGKVVALNWQFALGAATVPAVIGVSSRILSRTQWAIPRWQSQGAFLVVNGVAAWFVGGPFLWGALMGQIPVAIDVLSDVLADAIVDLHVRHDPSMPTGGERSTNGIGSAEPDAQGRSAGAVSAEDIAELQKIQQDLQMSGLGYRDREDVKISGVRMAGAPARFR